MNKIFVRLSLALSFFISIGGIAQTNNKPSFKVVPLGVKGGSDESNLSAYLIAPAGTNNYVCADAGTLRFGIRKAIGKKVFKANAATVLKTYIKGYLISHAHLDHVAGLIINSPDDTSKNIYAMPYVINILRDNYFTWQSWANFADEGDKPALNKYRYVALQEENSMPVVNTGMDVRAFSLSHSNPYQSTAFLLNSKQNCLLYFGDTGADQVEKSDKMNKIWQYIAPLIKSHRLKAILIEVSFPNEQPDKQLFGHLTPRLLMEEMTALSNLCGLNALRNVPVVITHIKPSPGSELKIKEQLKLGNKLQLKIVYPRQGELLQF